MVPTAKSLGTSKVPELDVTGLKPGEKYKFCVTAVNNKGESDPLCTEIEIPDEDQGKYMQLNINISIYILLKVKVA